MTLNRKNIFGIGMIILVLLVFYKSLTLPNPGNYPAFLWTLIPVAIILVVSYFIAKLLSGKKSINWTSFFIINCIGYLILLYSFFAY